MGRLVLTQPQRPQRAQRSRASLEYDRSLGLGGSPSSSSSSSMPQPRTRAVAYGPSMPLALMNTPQGEAILREQIAELTARADHLMLLGDDRTANALRATIVRLQGDLADMSSPDIARYRRRVQELEAEAEHLMLLGDDRGTDALQATINELKDDIRYMTARAR